MMAHRFKLFAAAVTLFASLASSGHAESFFSAAPNSLTRSSGGGGYRHGEHRRWDARTSVRGSEHGFHGHHVYRHDIVGGDGIPSYVRGVGTFAGDMAAARFHRNGTYFYAQAFSTRSPQKITFLAPKAKVILVEQETNAQETKTVCSVEHGVCVIRGAP